jgi:Mg/Co/Ni transporter MgtE
MDGREGRMRYAILAGVILGCMHGLILWASMVSLELASFILHGDRYYFPLRVTLIIDAVAVVTVITSGYWLPFMMDLQEKYSIRW